MAKYTPSKIEPKWQKYWDDNKTFKTEVDHNRPKYYILDMFPYPSGAGLHVGHPEGYTATDIVARYKRMQGFNVLHPMGWDSFGLPAEQYAVQTGTHPAVTTKKNIETFKRQIKSLGFSYDWDREVTTSDPEYYKWTQWIFRKLYEKGLAYEAEIPVNWCPALGTVLANEEIIDGKSERGGHEVIKKPMRQWVLKITEYADRLLEDLNLLDWPKGILEMQENWIGRSVGAEIDFGIKDHAELSFKVFTTRPDTIFGATYCVLAPEHPLCKIITTADNRDQVESYISEAINKSERQRQEDAVKKTGIFTGAYAINPVSKQPIPIYIADYVLITYGTGAIMAVPGHDERDFAFAKKYSLPITQVVTNKERDINIENSPYVEDGIIINSDFLNDLNVEEAKEKIISYLVENKLGTKKINYKLRDWIFSRQRYWGEPFPLIHTEEGIKLLGEDQLPVLLPEVEKYQPTEDGEPPLARAVNWVNTTDPTTGKTARRETNTMPQWAGSCWYYLRFLSATNPELPWTPEEEKYWMPVDLYVGGVEHAVLHLLYARFWHKVLYDLGLVSTKEPFQRLVNQGLILGEDGQKMSKSRGNVINPDVLVEEYGADTLRLYEMFMGPLEQVKPWSSSSVNGVYKFLGRAWNMIIDLTDTEKDQPRSDIQDILFDENNPSKLDKILHKTIKKVTEDIEKMQFHTAISALMTFSNSIQELRDEAKASNQNFVFPLYAVRNFVKLLSPLAPHIAEELWSIVGNNQSIAYESWPKYIEQLTIDSTVVIGVQVNGKLRDTIEIEKDTSDELAFKIALEKEKVKVHTEGKEFIKKVYVPGRIVNFVVR